MTPERLNPASAAARTGSGNVCFGSEQFPDSPPRPNTQDKFQGPAEAEFDAEIALVLVGSGWRVTAGLLTLAAKYIEAGDLLSAERNRQRAREQFNEASVIFRQFQEAMSAEFRTVASGKFSSHQIESAPRLKPSRAIQLSPFQSRCNSAPIFKRSAPP
jgi:hypothetical protein